MLLWLFHRYKMLAMAYNAVNQMTLDNPKIAGMKNFYWQLKLMFLLYKFYVDYYEFCKTHTQREQYEYLEDVNRRIESSAKMGDYL